MFSVCKQHGHRGTPVITYAGTAVWSPAGRHCHPDPGHHTVSWTFKGLKFQCRKWVVIEMRSLLVYNRQLTLCSLFRFGITCIRAHWPAALAWAGFFKGSPLPAALNLYLTQEQMEIILTSEQQKISKMDWAQWLTFGWLLFIFFAGCFPRQNTYCQASGHSGHKPTIGKKKSIKTPGIMIDSSSRHNCMLSSLLNNTGKPETMTSGKFMTIHHFRGSVGWYILSMYL